MLSPPLTHDVCTFPSAYFFGLPGQTHGYFFGLPGQTHGYFFGSPGQTHGYFFEQNHLKNNIV